MANTIEGKLSAKGKKFGIVTSRFNELISKQLLAGAQDCLVRHDCKDTDITVVWVPGSFEIPFAAKKIGAIDCRVVAVVITERLDAKIQV